jgi:ankyrin repeat protein
LCNVSRRKKDDEVKKALEKLPIGLDNTYKVLLEEIDKDIDSLKSLALRSLQLVLYAQRRLRTWELQYSLAQVPRTYDSDSVVLDDPDVILEACSNLLTIDEGHCERWFRTTHYSVREYLTDPTRVPSTSETATKLIDSDEAHMTWANICLFHLCQPMMHLDPLCDQVSQDFILNYAARFFDTHISQSGRFCEGLLERCVETLLKGGSALLANVMLVRACADYDWDWSVRRESHILHWNQAGHKPVHPASFAKATLLGGFPKISSVYDGEGGSEQALLLACETNLKPAVLRLLAQGSDISYVDGSGRTALHIALHRRNGEISRLLVESHSDVNAQDNKGNSILQLAITQLCDPDFTELLLNKGAEVNAQGGYYGNALQAAAREGALAIVKLLVQHGADVNAGPNGAYGSALRAALRHGDIEMPRFLLDHGADAIATEGVAAYGTTLKAALSVPLNDCPDTVTLLFQHGATLDAQALHKAVFFGHYKSVKVLLEHETASRLTASELRTELAVAEKEVADLLSTPPEYSDSTTTEIYAAPFRAIAGTIIERLNTISE